MNNLESTLGPYHYQDTTRTSDFERRQDQRFDRIAFALQALRQLVPSQTRVAVFPSKRLQVQQGRDLAHGPQARWAMVGIPRDASARSIILALSRIDGVPRAPYALDATLEAAALAGRAN